MPFALTEERLGGGAVPVLCVSGEVDIFTAPEFRERLLGCLGDDAARHLVVDFSAATFVDSKACHALLQANHRLRRRDGRLAVVNTSPELARILAVMGLDELLTVVPSRDAALGALARADDAR